MHALGCSAKCIEPFSAVKCKIGFVFVRVHSEAETTGGCYLETTQKQGVEFREWSPNHCGMSVFAHTRAHANTHTHKIGFYFLKENKSGAGDGSVLKGTCCPCREL